MVPRSGNPAVTKESLMSSVLAKMKRVSTSFGRSGALMILVEGVLRVVAGWVFMATAYLLRRDCGP